MGREEESNNGKKRKGGKDGRGKKKGGKQSQRIAGQNMERKALPPNKWQENILNHPLSFFFIFYSIKSEEEHIKIS